MAQDAATAKAVAFNRDVMMKCVTHEGDMFDPSGTLTGGSRATGASVLAKLHALDNAEAELTKRRAELAGAHSPAAVSHSCERAMLQRLTPRPQLLMRRFPPWTRAPRSTRASRASLS